MKLKLPGFRRQAATAGGHASDEASEARYRAWVVAAIVLFGPPLLFYAYFRVMFPGLTNPDALDFAQLGRNLSAGHGFVTEILRPLALTHGPNPLAQPDVTHGPLFPFFLAIAFGALGPNDAAVAWTSGLFYILTIPVLYLLGSRVFGRTVGWITALVFATSSLMLEYAASGLHITLYIFLATGLFLTVYHLAAYARDAASRPGLRLPRGRLLLAGTLLGALYLTDPAFFWLIPVVIVAVALMPPLRRVGALAWFLVPLMVLALPWMGRNWALTGDPILGLRGQEFLMNTTVHPGFTAYRVVPSDLVLGVGLLSAVVKKVLINLNQCIQGLPQVGASWVLAFFLPSLFFRFRDPAATRLRAVVVAGFLVLLAGMVPFTLQMPLFTSLLPAMLVFAVAYLVHLTQQAQLSRGSIGLVASLFAVALAFPLFGDTRLGQPPAPLKTMGSAQALNRAVRRDEVVLTDQPWVTAWYADRPSLWIPADSQKLKSLKAKFGEIRGLFLTDQIADQTQFAPEWQFVYSVFQRFNVAYARLPEGKRAHVGSPRLSGRQAPKGLPREWASLIRDLDGLTWVPPVEKTPTTVVAALPAKAASAELSDPPGRTAQAHQPAPM